MAKKRKDVSQSNTLFDFFGKGASAAAATPKRPKLLQGVTPRDKVKRHDLAVVPAEDIIVIDDSDARKASAASTQLGRTTARRVSHFYNRWVFAPLTPPKSLTSVSPGTLSRGLLRSLQGIKVPCL